MASYPTPIDGHNRLPKTHRLAKRNEETLAEIASIIAKLPKNWKMYNLRDSVELRDLYLVRFYDECMIPNFPDKDELDPLEVWLEMFEPEYTHTVLHILVILNDNDQFAAGVVTEYYPKSNCGLLSYLLVQPDFRGPTLGLVSKITRASLLVVDISAQKADIPELTYYFCETNSPLGVLEINDNMPPRKRVRLFDTLSFRLANFGYVQHPLADDQSSANYLLLLVYNRDPNNSLTLLYSNIIVFLQGANPFN